MICDWNPVLHVSARRPPRESDCKNEAVLLLDLWKLCDSCVKLPEFDQYKIRYGILRL